MAKSHYRHNLNIAFVIISKIRTGFHTFVIAMEETNQPYFGSESAYTMLATVKYLMIMIFEYVIILSNNIKICFRPEYFSFTIIARNYK